MMEGQCRWEGRGFSGLGSRPRGGGAAPSCPAILAGLSSSQSRGVARIRCGLADSGRSRVSLSRLPSLIIPRELVGAANPAPALRAPSPATCVPRCTTLPVLCRGPCPKPPRAVALGSSIRSSPEEKRLWGGQGLGRGSNTIKKGTEGCSIARCRRLISLLLQIIRSCDCLIDHMIV